MSGLVLLNIQSRTEGEWLYIQHNTDAYIVNNLWNENMEKFVFFKDGEDYSDFCRGNGTKSSWKAV